MAQFQRHFVQELTKPLIVRQCGDLGFTGDNLSDVISVDLYTDGEAYSGGGTCAGACICPDGSTVALTGTVSGKTASVTLTEDCFAIPGQIGIGIRVTTGTTKTTVLKAIYNVEPFSTNNPVDPGSRIALDVADLVNRIDTAIASIPASADQLKAAMAPNFSATTAYPAGAYVWNNGTLYRFTTAHAAGSWTGTDAAAVALGNDVDDLKIVFAHSAPEITSIINDARRNFYNDSADWEQGAIVNGAESSSPTRVRTKSKVYIQAGTVIRFITSNYLIMAMYDLLGNYIETYPSNWSNAPEPYTMPSDRMIRLAVRNAWSTAILPADANTSLQVFSNAFDRDIQTLYANGGEYAPFADASDWEQGAINNGALVDSATRIRTARYWSVPKGAEITIKSGETDDTTAYNFYVYALFNPENGALIEIEGWLSGTTSFVTEQNVLLKLAVRRQNSGNITPSEINTSVMIKASGTVSEISKLKVLAMGDSICYGARNDRKGFIGEVGCQYVNTGSTGASISMAKANNIPKQLIELTGFSPDAIVTNGGINDYGDGVAMGDVPVRVIDPNNDNPESMNKNTVMGALNYLFYKMVTLYPNAQRFFLMPQHTWNWDRINGDGGWNFDTFHENVTKVCNMYGVKIIDLYTQSPINTRYAEYRSTTSYSETPPDTEKAWVNYDGIHPLPFGYTNGYVPFVKEALKTATHKET